MLYKYELIRIKTGRFRGLSVTLCIMRHHAHIAAYTIYNICRPSQFFFFMQKTAYEITV